jgi:uncharacterized protein (TIGR02147 family)
MAGPDPKIDIFVYRDYRKFLRDWYDAAKKTTDSISFRTLSKRGGFKSPNFFKLVMDGERNLSEVSLDKFITALHLNKREANFFRTLVRFNQASTSEEKERFYQQLVPPRSNNPVHQLEREQFEFYSRWYHPVIRELVTAADFDGRAEWLAARIKPRIAASDAQKSLELLQRLGLITRTDEGRWRQTTAMVTTGAEVSSFILMNYHRKLLDLTQEVLSTVPAEQRDVSTLTLGIKKTHIPQLKEEVRAFRKKILEIVADENATEEVVQMNIQIFPVTQKEASEES